MYIMYNISIYYIAQLVREENNNIHGLLITVVYYNCAEAIG